MAYKALYRQFRPRRFADLKGQDMIARVLKNQIMAANRRTRTCFPARAGRARRARQRFSPWRSTVCILRAGSPASYAKTAVRRFRTL